MKKIFIFLFFLLVNGLRLDVCLLDYKSVMFLVLPFSCDTSCTWRKGRLKICELELAAKNIPILIN